MAYLKQEGVQFDHHRHSFYVTDVMFQQAGCLCGIMMEARPYCRSKQKLHGYETDASLSPNGFCINLPAHAKDKEVTLPIFRERLENLKILLEKYAENQDFSDTKEEQDTHWAVLLDKGYRGILKRLRSIFPNRKPPFFNETNQEKKSNKNKR